MISAVHTTALAVLAAAAVLAGAGTVQGADGKDALGRIKHFVIIYQENHSFDNLYGGWGRSVEGLGKAVPQVDQKGARFACLPQVDLNLRAPYPLSATCTDSADDRRIASHFGNAPFPIEKFIAAKDKTCTKPDEWACFGIIKGKGAPGGCTMDLDHRFYQERYQIDGGKLDRYLTGSNAAGLTMGYYDTKSLPIYQYLHGKHAPRYVIADHFFQGAFGGSFLNHQWLIAARTPEWWGAVNDGSDRDLHSVVYSNGMPKKLPFYAPTSPGVMDNPLTASCSPAPNRGATPAGEICGDFAVNTIQPTAWPYYPAVTDPARRLPPLTTPTIGESLTAAGKRWAWYSGGWSDAEGAVGEPGFTTKYGNNCSSDAFDRSEWPRCTNKLFQFHHQPFNYFAAYAPGSKARKEHLRDEEEFKQLVKSSVNGICRLNEVSFVKPLGADNEHPGYASEYTGNSHLVELLKEIEKSACAKDTMVIVTYDEFGGQADHLPPPGPGNRKGPYDQWGPGTRIPALIIAPHLPHRCAVDHQEHDTTSILSTIEHRYGLDPLGSRDAAVNDLSSVFDADSCR